MCPVQPIHKRNDQITDIKHRLKMTYLATEDNPYFEVSKIEINQPGPSYTIDTVREFRKIYGWQTNIFLLQVRMPFEIDTWYKKDELIKLCQFVAAEPGYDLDKLNDNFKRFEVWKSRH